MSWYRCKKNKLCPRFFRFITHLLLYGGSEELLNFFYWFQISASYFLLERFYYARMRWTHFSPKFHFSRHRTSIFNRQTSNYLTLSLHSVLGLQGPSWQGAAHLWPHASLGTVQGCVHLALASAHSPGWHSFKQWCRPQGRSRPQGRPQERPSKWQKTLLRSSCLP